MDMLITAFLMIFRRFPTTFRRFLKIFQNCSESQRNVPKHFPKISENFRRCLRISEDYRRLSRKTRRCFDDTPTNLSTPSTPSRTESKTQQNIELMTFALTWCANIFVGRSVTPTFFGRSLPFLTLSIILKNKKNLCVGSFNYFSYSF